MLQKVWSFFKNPVYLETDCTLQEKIKSFGILVALAIGFSLGLGFIMDNVTSLVGYTYDNHAVMEMFNTLSPVMIFFAAVIIAPVAEELIFRAPLGLFKESRYFKYAYYTSVFLFGIIHISNFGDLGSYFWLIPLLVAPQISAGIFLGYIRTKFGLLWSMLLHAAHNMLILGPFIVMKILDIPFE